MEGDLLAYCPSGVKWKGECCAYVGIMACVRACVRASVFLDEEHAYWHMSSRNRHTQPHPLHGRN